MKTQTFIKGSEHRTAEHPIEPIFLDRWSPRAMSGESISREELMRLFEAARWAPSTYNEQEWRFVYARRETPAWDIFFSLLVESNQIWCKNAAALVVVVGSKLFQRNGKPNPVYQFDCGSAFENAALQGTAMGLVVHGMQGFHYGMAHTEIGVPENYEVIAMFAVGRPGDPAGLPEKFREMEKPGPRKPLREIVSEGRFNFEK